MINFPGADLGFHNKKKYRVRVILDHTASYE